MSTSEPGTPTTPAGDDVQRPEDHRAHGQNPYSHDPYGRAAYGQDPYGQGVHGQAPAAAAPRNGLGVAALVVGIVSLVLGLLPLVGFVGVVAVVLGVIALSRVRRGLATNRGASITGIVLGALAVVAGIAWLVLFVVLFNSDRGQKAVACVELPTAQQQQCISDTFGLQQP